MRLKSVHLSAFFGEEHHHHKSAVTAPADSLLFLAQKSLCNMHYFTYLHFFEVEIPTQK